VIDSVMNHRRTQVEDLLERVPHEHRAALVPGLRSLAAAGGENVHRPAWLFD
jgi:hypothetical protein